MNTSCSAELLCATVCASTALPRNICTDLGPPWLLSADKIKQFVRKNYFKKLKKQQSYSLFIYITLLEFPVFSLAKISERRKELLSPLRGTRAAHCVSASNVNFYFNTLVKDL